MNAIRRNRRYLWTALVVPVLLLRVLIPAGYMPAPGGLMLCPGAGSSFAAGSAPAMDMSGMDMAAMDMSGATTADHDPGAPAGPASHGDSCPFAAALAGYAPPSAGYLVAAPVLLSLSQDVLHPSGFLARSIDRTQGPRGPPTLALV